MRERAWPPFVHKEKETLRGACSLGVFRAGEQLAHAAPILVLQHLRQRLQLLGGAVAALGLTFLQIDEDGISQDVGVTTTLIWG